MMNLDESMMERCQSVLAVFCLCACAAVPLARASISGVWPFEAIAQAPVLATCIVEQTRRDPRPSGSERPVVPALAHLQILRSFPPSAIPAGERVLLVFDALSKETGMDGPNVPRLEPGDIVVLPLKLNPDPSSNPWRLIADDNASLVIPAIIGNPPFAAPPENGRDFLLYEMAAAMLAGTRPEMLAEAGYISNVYTQRSIAAGLMSLLESKLAATDDRWASIAAALLSSMAVPRPSVADLRNGKDTDKGRYSGSLIAAVLQKLGPSENARQSLIHHLVVNADIASWGVGMTVPEFAQEPNLVRELREMLRARSPGSLSVARSILIAGQREILEDATALSFYYLSAPGAERSEVQAACWVIRDFGTAGQFDRLVGEIRRSQYRDRRRYDELWRNIVWSDNDRKRAVLEILLKDDRIYQENQRYSDIARGEMARIQARGQ